LTIITSHPEPVARPSIDAGKCSSCGICATACASGTLSFADGKLSINDDTAFGCIACGHCMMACTENAIYVHGRGISHLDLVELRPLEARAGAEQLGGLMLARRSMRRFADRDVPREVLDRVLQMASSAPMGIPPSEVRVLVLCGHDKVRTFAAEMDQCFRGARAFFTPFMVWLMGLASKPAIRDFMKSFLVPLIDSLVKGREQGGDPLLYDAPSALLFYGAPFCDQQDMAIAATYAMLAAESLGLGTCMIGSVSPFLQRNKKLLSKYGIAADSRLGLVLLIGYPALRYRRGVRRRFERVNFAQHAE